MKTSYILSIIAIVVAALAAGAGLFVPGLYRDSEFLQTVWQGNDWVTLLAVVPAMVVVLLLYRKDSLKAALVWMGLLLYLFYNYAFYLFATAFNAVFMLYVAIFALSGYALIYGLAGFPRQRVRFQPHYRSWIIAYLLLIAFTLSMVEIPPIVTYLIEGTVPELVERTSHPTNVVYALDLSIVVPLSVLASVWLWQRRKWGYLLAGLMLVKGITYGLVLTVNSIILYVTDQGGDSLLPFYLFVVLGGIGGLVLLLRHTEVKDHQKASTYENHRQPGGEVPTSAR